ncbi:MAG: heme o synthase [Acidobacteriota bacterium]
MTAPATAHPETLTPDAADDGARAAARSAPPTRRADLFSLAKPRITFMVALTTAVGFLLASPRPLDWLALLHALIGTALVAGGASALNQVVEQHIDARMQRTARRPLPSGRLSRELGLAFGVALSIVGMAYLAIWVNLTTAVLGALTLAGYVFVYTPMKRVSSLSTIVGAVPGAVPPMMGVTAVTGRVDALAWALFGILFVWQMPHFLAIAWMYRSDYARGGFPMLTVLDEGGDQTARQMLLWAAALLPVSLLPSVLGVSGLPYLLGAVVLSSVFLGYAWAFTRGYSRQAARRVLLVSVLYLPVMLILLLVDRVIWGAGS